MRVAAAAWPAVRSCDGWPRVGWLTLASLAWSVGGRHARDRMGPPPVPGYDGGMSESEGPTRDGAAVAPPPTPGERRLAHPPSDRYRSTEASANEIATTDVAGSSGSAMRGVVLAIVAGIVGAVAIVLLGGVAAISAGLVVVAATSGWAVGAALKLGAGDRIDRRRRTVVAIAVAFIAIALAQVGLWQYALREGGVLPLSDYLGEVFGLLVPVEVAAAVVAAWVAAR